MSDTPSDGVPCLWMRGGTSKAAVFLASDLPSDPRVRDNLLLKIMGSPDSRQIDGIGGADPLTSKVAILSPSSRSDADIDYLFLQVFVDQPVVSDAQGCGNILAAVGPAAIERGLLAAQEPVTSVRIHMVNTGEVSRAQVATPNGQVNYNGNAHIDGVPGSHAAIPLLFENAEGSLCGSLLPSGRPRDIVEGVECTMIDNGMPTVILLASDFGLTGRESREDLDANGDLKTRLEAIRLAVGPIMNLGDVRDKSVPKVTLVSPPENGGTINTRSFIPHRCHASIGVFAAVSVSTACVTKGSIAAEVADLPTNGRFLVEHPTGAAEVLLHLDAKGEILGAGTLRTARKLFEGRVFPAP